MLKKFFRYSLFSFAGAISAVLIYLAAAFGLPYLEVSSSSAPCRNGITVYVRSNGVHTDFVVPVRTASFDWSKKIRLSDFEAVDTSFQYLDAGWGDKGFYLETPTWDDLKFSTAFRAAFGLGSTAMHISYRKYAPRTDDLCRRLVLSEKEYQRLVSYIFSSFQIKDGMPVPIKHPGYSERDCFYEARGSYSMFKTCNVWTGDGLRFAGRRAGIWTPFHRGVIDHCENH